MLSASSWRATPHGGLSLLQLIDVILASKVRTWLKWSLLIFLWFLCAHGYCCMERTITGELCSWKESLLHKFFCLFVFRKNNHRDSIFGWTPDTVCGVWCFSKKKKKGDGIDFGSHLKALSCLGFLFLVIAA